ncbi:unnamed protein product [Echinostoma caproni]|uniref:Nucleoprotein TPR n=1 Tax=Echinostoma caproni TaxID=27848 RepID=A0A183AA02_9TREM|nr:unnamed protein product [Echinostoma caproni]
MELSRLKDDLQSRLNEREAAMEMMKREVETNNARLVNNTRTLTHTETEILELRQKLELAESRTDKFREENSQYVTIVSSLEARLLERDKQMREVELCQATMHANHEGKRNTQLTDVIRELKQQLAESRKTSAISKAERAQLQETVSRLQGELSARSDALRQAALEAARLRRDQEAGLANQANEWRESMRLIEASYKAECERTAKLERELEEIRSSHVQESETLLKTKEDQRGLKSRVANLEERNAKLTRDLDSCREDKIRLEQDCALLTQKLDASRSEVQEMNNVLQTKLDSKVRELEQLIQNTSKSATYDRGIQTTQTGQMNPANVNETEQVEKIVPKTLELKQDRPVETKTQPRSEIKTSSWYNTPMNSERLWSLTDISSVESRVQALKTANQRLREEVASACKALQTSSLLQDPMKEGVSRSLSELPRGGKYQYASKLSGTQEPEKRGNESKSCNLGGSSSAQCETDCLGITGPLTRGSGLAVSQTNRKQPEPISKAYSPAAPEFEIRPPSVEDDMETKVLLVSLGVK